MSQALYVLILQLQQRVDALEAWRAALEGPATKPVPQAEPDPAKTRKAS